MNKTFLALGGFAAFVVVSCLIGLLILISTVVGTYNSLATKRQAVDGAWGQVENVYQRRFDLIPNLVKVVEAAAAFEKDTFTAIAQARASVGQMKVDPNSATPEQMAQFAAAQQGLGTALSRLLVVSEKYPDLKANANFRDMQAQLEGTENRITVERMTFNEKTQVYNTGIAVFPGNVLAGMFNFAPRPYYKVEVEGAKQAPVVKFGK